MNLIMKMIGFKIIKTHIIRYKKLDIMRFILKIFLNFPLKLNSRPAYLRYFFHYFGKMTADFRRQDHIMFLS